MTEQPRYKKYQEGNGNHRTLTEAEKSQKITLQDPHIRCPEEKPANADKLKRNELSKHLPKP